MLRVQMVTDTAGLVASSAAWEELLQRSAQSEPTLAPPWVLAWWRVFGPLDGRALRAVLFWDGPRLVGLAPFCERPRRHRVGLSLRTLELCGSGEDEADETGSDYLGVIVERGAESSVARALADALATDALGAWDELRMPAMRGDDVFPVLLSRELRARGASAHLEITGACPHIPLPASWDGYLAALPSSRRYMVRRSLRDLEAWAGSPLRLTRVTRADELPTAMETLIRLHEARWSADEKPGAFASPRFRAFHEAVMPALLERGSLDLSWLEVRGEPIAAVYNIVWQGRVSFYQGGRRPDLPQNLRAGIAMHALAIREAIAAGHKEYDFLAGTSRYKMDLSLAVRPLVRLYATRPSLTDTVRRVADLALDQARALRRAFAAPTHPSNRGEASESRAAVSP
ncbi:GNAT family N-acetyltransferase [Chondromyces crocatus]|uniref:Cellulose biosynthesis protein CelD n=1 Tax=Chondromyces crocatus TaxID=52 RepID=A0A0K1E630_CHOCO|nr:GNAT family N-acetyltransferase [Chondromyces crocatus]AKT36132.1 cellulose biosynthesis protein CelD [Chondromyces crocatus]